MNPFALELLAKNHYPTAGLRSKNWDEFAAPGAPELDFVITICDNAAGEVCPIWPGRPVTTHWGVEDPAAVTGTELDVANAFRRAFEVLEHRIKAFTSLPIDSLEHLTLQQHMDQIGQSQPPAAGA